MLSGLVIAQAPTPTPRSATAPWNAVVEHAVVLSSPGSKRPARMELSALAWNPADQELVAASDRGLLYRYRLRCAYPRALCHRGWLYRAYACYVQWPGQRQHSP